MNNAESFGHVAYFPPVMPQDRLFVSLALNFPHLNYSRMLQVYAIHRYLYHFVLYLGQQLVSILDLE